jgi:hypothetical protein
MRAREIGSRMWAILGAIALVGCEGNVTLDLETTAAADPSIAQVLVALEGVEIRGDGGTETLRFDDPVPIDLVQLNGGNLLRLFTEEELSDGRYTGVRLMFAPDDDEDFAVVLANGDDFPLTVVGDAFSDVVFEVDKDDSTRESIVLTLDLRQSLRFDDAADRYTLTPAIRAVRTEDAGRIAGNVTASCPAGTSLAEGGAVYLFAGEDVVPDDRDDQGAEPYLTVPVIGAIGVPGYSFEFVPAGRYTLALTCEGHEDDPATDDSIRFRDTANVRVQPERTATHDWR